MPDMVVTGSEADSEAGPSSLGSGWYISLVYDHLCPTGKKLWAQSLTELWAGSDKLP